MAPEEMSIPWIQRTICCRVHVICTCHLCQHFVLGICQIKGTFQPSCSIFCASREHGRDCDLRCSLIEISNVTVRIQHCLQGEAVLGGIRGDIGCTIQGSIPSHGMSHDSNSGPVHMPKRSVQGRLCLGSLNCVQHIFPMVVITFPSTCRRSHHNHSKTGH